MSEKTRVMWVAEEMWGASSAPYIALFRSKAHSGCSPKLVIDLPEGVEPPPDEGFDVDDIVRVIEWRHRKEGGERVRVRSTLFLSNDRWCFLANDANVYPVHICEPIPDEPDVVEAWEAARDHVYTIGAPANAKAIDAGDALAAEVRELRADKDVLEIGIEKLRAEVERLRHDLEGESVAVKDLVRDLNDAEEELRSHGL